MTAGTNGTEAGMAAALAEARLAGEAGEVPVGAAVFRDGEMLASAQNERERRQDPTAHAEILALRRAAETLRSRRLRGCTLYVTLEPCAMCAGAAIAAGVERIVFGAWDPERGCAGSLYALPEDPALAAIPCVGGAGDAACSGLLKSFFEKRRAERGGEEA